MNYYLQIKSCIEETRLKEIEIEKLQNSDNYEDHVKALVLSAELELYKEKLWDKYNWLRNIH